MDDILETIDRMHARLLDDEIKLLQLDEGDERMDSDMRIIVGRRNKLRAMLEQEWPVISDRLREAERKAKAFDIIEQAWIENRFDITIGGSSDDEFIDIDASGSNLLTAIESALAAGKETT